MIKFDSEAALETFIFDNIEKFSGVITAGGESISHHRQLSLPSYGCTDIVAVERSEFCDQSFLVSVIELKNAPITKANLAQLCRYMNYFEKLADKSNIDIDVYGFLVGPKTFHKSDSSDDVFLMQAVNQVCVVEFGLCPESGFTLKNVEGWSMSSFDDSDHSSIIDLLEIPPKEAS
jgi:hypothetical protein